MESTEQRAAEEFAAHRGYLLSVAYRLTGSWADAEDAVADAWPRWRAAHQDVRSARAWLTKVVSRIALDQLRSARARRETYVGPWLPEPVVTDSGGAVITDDPAAQVVLDEGVRMALLVVLDNLTPEQRVAVVLHDALGLPFGEVAAALGCSAQAARQHASRGRRRLAGADLPVPDPPSEAVAVLGALEAALRAADAERVAALLAPDVVMLSAGGGRVSAARRPLVGAAEVGRFLLGLARYFDDDRVHVQPVGINGDPGLLVRFDTERKQDPKLAAYAFTISGGKVRAVHAVLAPDKVSHLPGSPYPRPQRSSPERTPHRS